MNYLRSAVFQLITQKFKPSGVTWFFRSFIGNWIEPLFRKWISYMETVFMQRFKMLQHNFFLKGTFFIPITLKPVVLIWLHIYLENHCRKKLLGLLIRSQTKKKSVKFFTDKNSKDNQKYLLIVEERAVFWGSVF